MGANNNQQGNAGRNIIWRPLIVIGLLAAALIAIEYVFKAERRFTVVKVNGNCTPINISKNYNLTQFSSQRTGKGALLGEKGDLLAFNNAMMRFTKVKDDSLNVNDSDDSLVFINGKISSIVISAEENLLPWFRTMTASTVDNLQNICFTSKIPDSYVPFLKELARLKPNTDLCFEQARSDEAMDGFLKQADNFTPSTVRITVKQRQLPLLSHFKTATCLYLDIADSAVTIPLPAMPAMTECIIFGNHLKTIAASFFEKNTQLEKLTLITNLTNYTFLQPLQHLQEMSVTNDSADVSALKNKLNDLSVLIISGNYNDIGALANLKKLRWLGLPANTSQQQLNTIAAQLKDLEVLELQGDNSVTSLVALQQLHSLKGLIITDTVTDKKALYSLKDLRYLSVPEKNKSDSIYLLALQQTLPGCIIVPNSGACLGSGWLLLLLPLVILLFISLKLLKTKPARSEPN